MYIKIRTDTRAYECYQKEEVEENYYCNFGINPNFKNKLVHPEIQVSGVDQGGEIRIIEVKKNDFFISTLFVPQTKSIRGRPHPIIKKFIKEANKRRRA